jgi:hypothetical protein
MQQRLSNQRHELIFHPGHLEAQLQGTDAKHEVVNAREFSRSAVSEYHRLFTEYLLARI